MQLLLVGLLLAQLGNFTDDHPDTAPIRFALDELNRLAIAHNKGFRPTYDLCQSLLNAYIDVRVSEGQDFGKVVSLKQLQLIGKLKGCASQLEKDYKKLKADIEGFSKPVDKLE